eukprot:TRINITY_DN12153_c0_g1_i1.p1 TRINITY_DN12153_c0_g1~~TRINITY_DN12153_c0_g1_i1.p1  ORF type:complete len:204 (+),score=54.16 TRINITY_DN12153_c0_g1_i1:449-1060(+)
MFFNIVQGISHLHSIGVVHRDIKLENVLLDEQGNPKLTDFNLSFIWSQNRTENSFCGSLPYCCPEMLIKAPYTGPEVDVWALGVLLYSFFHLTFPFAFKGGVEDMAERVLHYPLRFPLNSRASDHAVDLMTKMMTVNPNKRITLSCVKNHPWFDDMKEGAEYPAPSPAIFAQSMKKKNEAPVLNKSMITKSKNFVKKVLLHLP